MYIALFVIMAIFTVTTKGTFISSRNIVNLVNQTGYIAVLAVGMFETSTLHSHFQHWNDKGTPSLELISIGIFFGVTKRAISRIVVQLIALGYGIVRPSIGEDMTRVLYLGGTYFLLSLAYSFGTSLPNSSKSVENQSSDLLSLILFFTAGITRLPLLMYPLSTYLLSPVPYAPLRKTTKRN